jgi:anaerobic C4-dicarboxylate transporter
MNASYQLPVRRRCIYALLIVALPALGIATRAYADALPVFVARYAPDTLWALLVFTIIALVAARLPTVRIALLALATAFLIETSQLYHASWIDDIRTTRIGGLILGFGFLWSDLLCYAVGVALGVVLDRLIVAHTGRPVQDIGSRERQ